MGGGGVAVDVAAALSLSLFSTISHNEHTQADTQSRHFTFRAAEAELVSYAAERGRHQERGGEGGEREQKRESESVTSL